VQRRRNSSAGLGGSIDHALSAPASSVPASQAENLFPFPGKSRTKQATLPEEATSAKTTAGEGLRARHLEAARAQVHFGAQVATGDPKHKLPKNASEMVQRSCCPIRERGGPATRSSARGAKQWCAYPFPGGFELRTRGDWQLSKPAEVLLHLCPRGARREFRIRSVVRRIGEGLNWDTKDQSAASRSGEYSA
jgi:hypothetical protein